MAKKKLTDKEKLNAKNWQEFMDKHFNEGLRQKQMLLYTWYLGDSDLLTEAYIQASHKQFANNYRDNRNSRSYFWKVATQEPEFKCTHSGLPKAIIQTFVNIIGIDKHKVMLKAINEDGELEMQENEVDTARLDEILEFNDMESILTKQQEPMLWTMGDGVYLLNLDKSISDKFPLIEYVDARNFSFDIKSNQVVKVYTRSYYSKDLNGYMLLQTRYTDIIEGKKVSCIKYNLFMLNNSEDRTINCEVSLDTLEETKDLENVAFMGIDSILAVPVIYDYEPIQKRGTSMFSEKMDLFDDLDQCLSQNSNCIRLSTPIEQIDEQYLEHDSDGKAIKPNTFYRKYLVTNSGVNSVGSDKPPVNASVPQIDFGRYSNEAKSLTEQIIVGLISPSTLGLNVARNDNGLAQREKEKETMFTRTNLIKVQKNVLSRLYKLCLQLEDYLSGSAIADYDVVVDYEEYGNPTFESKLQTLSPVFASGGMSANKYVELLYGDSLTDEEKEKEIEYLNAQRQSSMNVIDEDNMGEIDAFI